MLTRTLRRMERDGIVARTVYPAVPPEVAYRLTPLGESLEEPWRRSRAGRSGIWSRWTRPAVGTDLAVTSAARPKAIPCLACADPNIPTKRGGRRSVVAATADRSIL